MTTKSITLGAYAATVGLALTSAAALTSPSPSHAETVVYSFQGGNDGSGPSVALISDSAGNLYGTTDTGGGTGCDAGNGCGTVFRIAPNGTEIVLHAFQGGPDGAYPLGGLIEDASGNLYGTTQGGGSGCPNSNFGCGTIFKIAPDTTETILYAFNGGSDGANPFGGVVADKKGNLYGTTYAGGDMKVTQCSDVGCGTVFKLRPTGKKIILHTFEAANDGFGPSGSLTRDSEGNLYGTTQLGGPVGPNCSLPTLGCGTAYKVSSAGAETVIYSFLGGNDGSLPTAGMIEDKSGNFYGTTELGGNACAIASGCGTIFRIAATGTESVLYAFRGGSDGSEPYYSGVIADKAGNLYGTTSVGGDDSCLNNSGCGTVFKLAPNGAETLLYTFGGGTDGANPAAGLLKGPNNILYGTASGGGADGHGVVFSLTK